MRFLMAADWSSDVYFPIDLGRLFRSLHSRAALICTLASEVRATWESDVSIFAFVSSDRPRASQTALS